MKPDVMYDFILSFCDSRINKALVSIFVVVIGETTLVLFRDMENFSNVMENVCLSFLSKINVRQFVKIINFKCDQFVKVICATIFDIYVRPFLSNMCDQFVKINKFILIGTEISM